jgi:hypothetical protein
MKGHRHRSLPGIITTLMAALLCACSAEKDGLPDSPPSDGGHDGGSAIDGGGHGKPDAGSEDAGFCPPAATYGGGEETIVPGAVSAKLVDETGAPVAAGQPLYICGINICISPKSVGTGGTAAISTNVEIKKPAFKYGDGIEYAEFAIPLTTSPSDFRMQGTGLLATARLADKSSAPLVPGADATSGDVTVSLAAGAAVSFDDLIYDTAESQVFRAVNIPLTNAGPLLPAEPEGFALLYGVSPARTTVCPAAKVTVKLPDNLGWAPGAPVEFWITTTDIGQTYAPYAGWALMSEGEVSEDGKTVVTSEGQGFLALEHFAIRLKP